MPLLPHPLRPHPQGLRSGTQTVGCFVSLYLLSPKLTGLLLVALPVLVGAGAFIGAFLRSLSRQAQEQVTLTWEPLSCHPRGRGVGCPNCPPVPAGGQGHRGGRRGAG